MGGYRYPSRLPSQKMADDPKQLDPSTLQQETRRLRVLARDLCGDPHLAEDLVQEAWVTALERPPRAGFNLSRWLRGITRNHARQERRESGRRQRREQRAARPEGQEPGGAEAQLERLDLLRHVLTQIRGLQDPYRGVLLRHYLEGQSPKQIAAALGCPATTVRTWLHRGLALLRQRLDAQHQGSRRAWLLPLIPLCEGPPPLPLPPSKLLPMAQLTAHKTGFGLALAFLVCCAVGVALWIPGLGWFGMEPTQVPEEAQVSSGAALQVDAGRQGAPGVESAAAGREALRAEKRSLRIRGTVRDEQGQALAGARVEAVQQALTSGIKGVPGAVVGSAGPSARSDDQGRYELQVEIEQDAAPRALRLVSLRAAANGHVRSSQTLACALDAAASRADFRLRKSLQIRGRVLDTQGAPVAGARVWTWDVQESPVRSDVMGRFVLHDLDPRQDRHLVHATAPGFIGQGRYVTRVKAGAGLELRLSRGARVTGRVRDASGQPAVGARILLGWGKDELVTRADAAGWFAFDGARPGKTWLRAEHPGSRPLTQALQVPEPGQTVDLDLQLEAGRVLRGRVVDGGGRGIRDALVQALGIKGSTPSARSAADGSFELGGLPAEVKLLSARAAGFATAHEPVAAGQPGEIRIEMQVQKQVFGQVLRAGDGEPVQSFELRLIAGGAPVKRRKGTAGGKGVKAGGGKQVSYRQGSFMRFSSSEGKFLVTLPDGLARYASVGVEVRAPGLAPQTRTAMPLVVEPDAEPVQIFMQPGQQLTGEVRLPDGSPVAAGTTVSLLGEGGTDSKDPAAASLVAPQGCDGVGRFRFENVPAGRLSLLVRHERFGSLVHAVEVQEGRQPPYQVLRFASVTTLRGKVLDRSGKPLAGEAIMLLPTEVAGARRNRARRGKSDGEGAFRFADLQKGLYRLSLVRDFGKKPVPAFSLSLRIHGAATQDVTLSLEGSVELQGRIRTEASLPAEIVIELTPIQDQDTPPAERRYTQYELADRGRFCFPFVRPGAWRVSARWEQDSRRVQASEEIRVSEGAPVPVVLTPR